mgnify:CR=1 FL=1
MNNAELFHRWANRVKDHGKSGNVFYEGPVLYSYGHHFPLAVLTSKKTAEGREIVLVNSRKYSVTTGKHKGMAVSASRHKAHIYVPAPKSPAHPSNLVSLNAETVAACTRLVTIRSGVVYAENAARDAVEDAKLYRKTFLKGRGHVVPLPKDFDTIMEKARERGARHDAARAVVDERRQAEWKRRRELDALADVEKIAAWRAGESVYLSWNAPCMLRLKPGHPDTVQTSMRAEIPLSHARRVYGLILGIMAKGEDWESNGHTIPVGVYKVDKITASGELHAGCHTITSDEIARFAGERRW